MNAAPISRLILVGAPKEERDAKIRRYRLARLKLEDADSAPRRGAERFAHLKRTYD